MAKESLQRAAIARTAGGKRSKMYAAIVYIGFMRVCYNKKKKKKKSSTLSS